MMKNFRNYKSDVMDDWYDEYRRDNDTALTDLFLPDFSTEYLKNEFAFRLKREAAK